jgi:hypothetical protein
VKYLILILGLSFACFAGEGLWVYKDASEKSRLGELTYADTWSELPVPPKKEKKVSYKKDKKGKRKRVVTYVEVKSNSPPEYIPVKTKFGKGYVKRAALAEFKQRSLDLSGIYESATGQVYLQKSPNNPEKYNVTIINGAADDRAEFEAGNLGMQEKNGVKGIIYKEESSCNILVLISGRVATVKQKGCEEYNGRSATLEGVYDRYQTGGARRAETFKMQEENFRFRTFIWCPEGPSSCEKSKGENGKGVEIKWSAGGEGLIERHGDGQVHTYRPYERVIPSKKDWYQGEKPLLLKTRRTDMANEWMLWYYYPKSGRLKMVRYGTRDDAAYAEIFEN